MKSYEGINLLANRYMKNKGISHTEAENRIKEVLQVFEESFLDTATDGIQFVDFLTLKKVQRKAKLGRNPLTKVEYIAPEKMVIKAVLGKRFDNELNK